MKFHVGPIPEDPTFSPEAEGWTRLREPRAAMLMAVAIPLGVLMAGVVAWVWSAIVHYSRPTGALTFTITLPGLLAAAALLLGFMALHELLHAIPVMIAGSPDAVVVGFWPRYLAPYAAYTGALSRETQMLCGSLPLLLLTVLPFGVALAVPNATLWMAGMSIMNALGSSADLIMLVLLVRQVPRGALVRNNGNETWWRMPGSLGQVKR